MTELLSPAPESVPNADSSDRTHSLAAWLKVVGDPTRLRILDLLMEGTQCNCELGAALGLAPNLISHHLAVLRRAGLVRAERHPTDARWVYYSVDHTAVGEIVREVGAFFDPSRMGVREPCCDPPGSTS